MKQQLIRYVLASTFVLSLNSIALADEVADFDDRISMSSQVTEIAPQMLSETDENILTEVPKEIVEESAESLVEEILEEVLLISDVVEETPVVVDTFSVSDLARWETEAIAIVSSAVIEVNGEATHFATYSINEHNYVKTQDLAYALSKTASAFDFEWSDHRNGFVFTKGVNYINYNFAYTVLDGEAKNATLSPINSYHEGEVIGLVTYLVNNQQYIQLDQMSRFLDFTLGWDQETKRITLDTKILG